MKPNSLSMDRHHKAHLYDISTAIDEVYSFFMWKIVINDLPKLKEEVTALLADNS